MGHTLGAQVNTDLARCFRGIVTAGWANLSEGDVEAPTGHFAIVHIEPAELKELTEAFEDDAYWVQVYPGSYLVREDSNGNTTVIEYITLDRAMADYNQLVGEFLKWSDQ